MCRNICFSNKKSVRLTLAEQKLFEQILLAPPITISFTRKVTAHLCSRTGKKCGPRDYFVENEFFCSF
jgi:hypothetical protein